MLARIDKLVLVIFGLPGSADRLGLSLFSFRLGTIFLVPLPPVFYPLVGDNFVGVRLGASITRRLSLLTQANNRFLVIFDRRDLRD